MGQETFSHSQVLFLCCLWVLLPPQNYPLDSSAKYSPHSFNSKCSSWAENNQHWFTNNNYWLYLSSLTTSGQRLCSGVFPWVQSFQLASSCWRDSLQRDSLDSAKNWNGCLHSPRSARQYRTACYFYSHFPVFGLHHYQSYLSGSLQVFLQESGDPSPVCLFHLWNPSLFWLFGRRDHHCGLPSTLEPTHLFYLLRSCDFY